MSTRISDDDKRTWAMGCDGLIDREDFMYLAKRARSRKRKPRRPSIREMVTAAEKAGTPLASITLPDGTKLDFTKAEQQGNELDQWIAKHADKAQRH